MSIERQMHIPSDPAILLLALSPTAPLTREGNGGLKAIHYMHNLVCESERTETTRGVVHLYNGPGSLLKRNGGSALWTDMK